MQRILQALWVCDVDYVVIGGVAVALYGIPRTTVDLDLMVRLTPENLTRLWRCLESLGLRPRQPVSLEMITDPATRNRILQEKHARVITFENPSDPLEVVDILMEESLPFEEVFSRRQVFHTGEFGIPVPAVEDLMALKARTGRPVDRSDVEALKLLQQSDEEA